MRRSDLRDGDGGCAEEGGGDAGRAEGCGGGEQVEVLERNRLVVFENEKIEINVRDIRPMGLDGPWRRFSMSKHRVYLLESCAECRRLSESKQERSECEKLTKNRRPCRNATQLYFVVHRRRSQAASRSQRLSPTHLFSNSAAWAASARSNEAETSQAAVPQECLRLSTEVVGEVMDVFPTSRWWRGWGMRLRR